MYDLKKLEEKFHEYLRENLDEEFYHIDEIKLTEELLYQEEAFYILFGWVSYFLVIEDEKPAVYAHALTRMDVDTVAFIYEDSYEDYDIWGVSNPKMAEKYRSRAIKVKGFNYDDLKFINDPKK